KLAVDASAQKSLLQQIDEQVLVFALLTLNERRENRIASPLWQPEHSIQNLLTRLSRNRSAALVTTGRSDASEQNSQVLVDLGDRPDRTARISTARLLLNGDRRSQSGNRIDVWLGHLAQKLSSIR